MIIATIRMAIPPQKRDEALKILTSMAEQWRDEPGCLSCSIYRDLEEKNVLMLEEVWKSQEDLDLHLRTDEYRNLLLSWRWRSNSPRSGLTPSRVPRALRPLKRQETARERSILRTRIAGINECYWEDITTIKKNKEGLL